MHARNGPAPAPRMRPTDARMRRYPLPAPRDSLQQPLPVMAAANEQFKKAKALGLGEADFSAVYEAAAPAAPRKNGAA